MVVVKDDTIEGLADELKGAIDPYERDRIAGETFNYLFKQYADMALATVYAEMAVGPEGGRRPSPPR